MRTWTLSEAQGQLQEILRLCAHEPQILYDQSKPLGVLVDVRFFDELMNLRTRQYRPTIAELFEELKEIHKLELAVIDPPLRQDRPNAMIEAEDGIPV